MFFVQLSLLLADMSSGDSLELWVTPTILQDYVKNQAILQSIFPYQNESLRLLLKPSMIIISFF